MVYLKSPKQQAAMVEYYSLADAYIKMVTKMVKGSSDSPLRLNTKQCIYLAAELAEINAYLESEGYADSLVSGQDRSLQTSLLHLLNTIKKAKLLVAKCCCQNSDSSWLVGAMTLVEIQEEFAAIDLDLQERKMILEYLAIATAAEVSHETKWNQLESNEKEYQELETRIRKKYYDAAKEDEKLILLKLAEVQVPQYSQLDCLRASFLRSWLTHTEGDDQTTFTDQSVFNVNKKVGEGSFCKVLSVTWLGVPCALKLLKSVPADNREARIMRDLHHPNIIPIYLYWENPSPSLLKELDSCAHSETASEECEQGSTPRGCLLMELMPDNLATYMDRLMGGESSSSESSDSSDGESFSLSGKVETTAPFSLPVAIDIMLQIAQAMLYLHTRNVTHRDLKPQNILVTERLTDHRAQGYLDIKLGDFGSAKVFDGPCFSRRHTLHTGTTVYSAPEILDKDWATDDKCMMFGADVWSFGITCAQILSGKQPYKNESTKTLHEKISKDGLRPTLPEHCPEYLAFCITGCWEYKPENRPDFASICKLLQHAKWLSLGLTSPGETKLLLKYTTLAGLVKTYEPSSQGSWFGNLIPSSPRAIYHRSASKRHRLC